MRKGIYQYIFHTSALPDSLVRVPLAPILAAIKQGKEVPALLAANSMTQV